MTYLAVLNRCVYILMQQFGCALVNRIQRWTCKLKSCAQIDDKLVLWLDRHNLTPSSLTV